MESLATKWQREGEDGEVKMMSRDGVEVRRWLKVTIQGSKPIRRQHLYVCRASTNQPLALHTYAHTIMMALISLSSCWGSTGISTHSWSWKMKKHTSVVFSKHGTPIYMNLLIMHSTSVS